jgi:hypothetical protein
MSIISFETKTYKSGALLLASRPNLITIRIHKIGANKLNECYLPISLLEQVKKLKNHTALVAFAKANQITDSASDAHSGSDSASVPSCPVPVPTPAKSSEQVQDILFIEVETAGRGKDAEIVEISVVNSAETVLFHSFIKPVNPKHIQVYDAPTFAEVWQSLSAVIGRADIAFYNAEHSKRMILQSIAKAFDTPLPKHFYTLFPHSRVVCVGERYKDFNNYRLGYFRNYGLQHINSACGQSGIFWRDLSSQAADNAIKSARIYNYLSYKAVA